MKLIRYSDQIKMKKHFLSGPSVFSYSYNEILIFKELISKNFSNKHLIIFGTNKLNKKKDAYYNSMLLVNNDLEILQNYYKKLVPFGEFLPFENLPLFWFEKNNRRTWIIFER